jgi:hypothetical protein
MPNTTNRTSTTEIEATMLFLTFFRVLRPYLSTVFSVSTEGQREPALRAPFVGL